jgi:pimeloyl-ACP methyl ester carboxylesterase
MSKSDWKVQTTDSAQLEEKYGVFQIYTKVLNGEETLVVLPGFSEKSCLATRDVINSLLDDKVIANRYSKVVVINLSPFKELQTKNDQEDNARDVDISNPNYRNEKWASDIAMKQSLAKVIDKIIRANGFNNVHLLGKSAGGGLAMNVVLQSDIYTKLYLAVPAHPLFCKSLESLGEQLNSIPIRIGWNSNDDFNLYNIVSNQQMPHYEVLLADMKKKYHNLDYVQCHFSPGNGHEVNPSLLYL